MRLDPPPKNSSQRMCLRGASVLLCLLVMLAPQRASAERATTHVVKLGESLRSVAEKYDCSLKELFTANTDRVRHPHLLGVGVRLTIPKCAPSKEVVDPEQMATPAADARPGPQHCGWTDAEVDRDSLSKRLLETMERLPDYFQAIVIETTPTKNGAHIAAQRVLVHGAVDRAEGWHPGLSVSIFSGLGALTRTAELGMFGDLEVVFQDDNGPQTTTLGELLYAALGKGSAPAHNRLVQIAGTDRLHGDKGLFATSNLPNTTLKRAFDSARWADLGQPRGLRRAPRIGLRQGTKALELPMAVGKPLPGCDQEACTTITDLARTMCLVTQHKRLPSSRRLPIGIGDEPVNLQALTRAMQRPKRRTPGHVEYAFMNKLSSRKGYQLTRRWGREDGWSTFVLGVTSTKGRREYVVAMTAHGSRRPLDEVANTLAGLLKAEDL
ncbi:MAG: LysM peptidoglycan-binding domain-containing protein [Myxococcota bacterium]